MSSVLLVIDSYISSQERADACRNLILKIRKAYPEKEILLINKYKRGWNLEGIADHYYYTGGFMVGYPPEDILEKKLYERPYTYVNIGPAVFENWFPLVNVTDHVANIFNSFYISSRIANMLGYERVFKIEYDTDFDEEDLLGLRADIENFQDFVFYGTRKEGVWAKPHHYLIDVHMVGFSTRCFDTFSRVKNDEDFWNLCKRINYYGKWIEYIIPMTIEQRNRELIEAGGLPLVGTHFPGKTSERFPKTKFDCINSPSEWTESMRNIPKICRTGNSQTEEIPNTITLFYHNAYDEGDIIASCTVEAADTGALLYQKTLTLRPSTDWAYDCMEISSAVKITTTTVHPSKTWSKTVVIDPASILNLDPRLLFK